jgi:ribosomal protein S6--L-glutamate ligase
VRLGLLSRNRSLYSIRRLREEGQKLGIRVSVMNPLECQLILEPGNPSILLRGKGIKELDAILPRIGASITEYGLAVVRQFEALGIPALNTADAILLSRNKFSALQRLTQHHIPVPVTTLTRTQKGLRAAVHSVKGFPIVLKVLQGTQGLGVMLVHSPVSLGSVVETLRNLRQDVLIQEFLQEASGRDYRVLVVGGKVIATMMRTAPTGEFRANYHLGGDASAVKLPKAYLELALKAVAALGLDIAGVDLLEGPQGPVVIEVNSSPGFEGIESATKINVARAMMKYAKARFRA